MNRYFRKVKTILALVLLFVLLVPAKTSASSSFPDIKGTIADVEFIQGENVPALDPDDPSKLLPDSEKTENSGNMITGQSGSLSINVVPNLHFGNNKFEFKEKDYYAQLPVKPYVQVSDLRGTGEGWSLRVQASRFTIQESGKAPVNTLKDAVIHLKNGTVLSSNENLMNTDKMPTLNRDIRIKCSGVPTDEVEVINANKSKNQGMGAWVARWYPVDEKGKYISSDENKHAYLSLPVKSVDPGSHKVTLTWTLVNTPV